MTVSPHPLILSPHPPPSSPQVISMAAAFNASMSTRLNLLIHKRESAELMMPWHRVAAYFRACRWKTSSRATTTGWWGLRRCSCCPQQCSIQVADEITHG